MRKRLAMASGAILAIAVTGALAAQLLGHKMSAVIEDRTGHMWRMTSDYRGEARLYDPQHHPIGVVRNSQPGSTPEGTVELDVAGAHVVLHGAEKREIRGSDNALLGYVEMTTTTDKQYKEEVARGPKTLLDALRQSEDEELKYGGVSGVSASFLGANGWDKQLAVSWKVRGPASVTVYNPTDKVVGSATSGQMTDAIRRQIPADALPPLVPRIEITVHGKTHTEQGYGSHLITNDAGKLLLRLDVKPLPGAEGDKAAAAHDKADAPVQNAPKNSGSAAR